MTDEGFIEEERSIYTDLATVESQRNDLVPEEFPEGSYGMSIDAGKLGKRTPWRKDQRAADAFGYENRSLHEDLERVYPGDQNEGRARD